MVPSGTYQTDATMDGRVSMIQFNVFVKQTGSCLVKRDLRHVETNVNACVYIGRALCIYFYVSCVFVYDSVLCY